MQDKSVPLPQTMSLSAFNKHMGYRGRYAYQLHKDGRLVMTEDGKRVLVAESVQRIEETRDPSRAGVAARHAATRAAADTPAAAALPAQPPEPNDGQNYSHPKSKAKREHFAALREEAAYRKEIGGLMDADEAMGAFADAGARLAAVLDAVPATVGPMLIGLPQDEVLRVLTEQMDIARHELAAATTKLAREIEQRRSGGQA